MPKVPGIFPQLRTKFANPFSQPLLSGSKLVSTLGSETAKAELAADYELRNWSKFLTDNIVKEVGDNPGLRSNAMKYVQGELDAFSAGPRAQKAGDAYRVAMKDFAKRLGLPEWENYATHVTDFDAIYGAFQNEFKSKNFMDLDPRVKVKVGSQETFDKLKGIFNKYPFWQKMPGPIRKDIKDLWNFNDFVSEWRNLPEFVQNQLPEELFMPYLLPRKSKTPYVEDIVHAFQNYVPRAIHKIHFDPLMSKWGPVTNALPGSDAIGTEKGYLRKMLERTVLGRPTKTSVAMGSMFDRVNEVLGKEIFTTAGAQTGASLLRSGFYRGSLGLDSAVINTTQSINTWAETGRLLGPTFKFLRNIKTTRKAQEFFGEFAHMATEEFKRVHPTSRTLHDKLLNIDSKLNKIFLSPMSVTEFTNRGIAFWAGMEESIAKGLPLEKGFVNAAAKASEVVPNLQLSKATLSALEVVYRTQFGATPATRTPFFTGPLGRISTIFTTYPTQQAQFIVKGFKDAIQTGDKAKLLRFLTLTGAYASLPFLLAKVGVDIRNAFGAQGVFGNMTLPVYQFIANAYNSVLGKDPYSKDRARESMGEFLKTASIPLYRYGTKAAQVYEDSNRGYAVDKMGRYLYDTTPAGEIMRLFGINPEERYQTRALARTMAEMAMEYRLDKSHAIMQIMQGDLSAELAFTEKWGKPITSQDLQKVQKIMNMMPYERAGRGLPKDVYHQLLAENLD